MTFKDWLKKQTVERSNRVRSGLDLKSKNYLFDELRLNDGMSLSVQASEFHKCEPRETISDDSEYTQVEVYSHGKDIQELVDYEAQTMFEYNYVPVEVMEELVKRHGGIKES